MKIAILGYGEQGRAAYDYWNTPENEITIHDIDPNVAVPSGAHIQLGPDYLKDLDKYDLLVRIPGLHPSKLIEALSDHPEVLKRITTVTNEFFRVCQSRNIIGVTGTKGKGTTATLIAAMLLAAGKRVHLGGNIGIAPLDMLQGAGAMQTEQPHSILENDYVVLELANFQLIDLRYSPAIAVCLMISKEHLNWHKDMEEYVESKKQLFARQVSGDVAIYYNDDKLSQEIAEAGQAKKIPYMSEPGAYIKDDHIIIDGQVICATSELKLLGKHNWQNVCAAVTATWQVSQDVDAIRSVLTTFTGLDHRLEFVREVEGVKYYDDSFGTTPETARVAIEAFSAPKVIILGGSTKESDFGELAKAIAANNVRKVILIGNTSNTSHKTAAPEIKAALKDNGVHSIISLVKPNGPAMHEVVAAAHSAAQKGDVVILSAACASFDMFKNYKDRGEKFQIAVKQL